VEFAVKVFYLGPWRVDSMAREIRGDGGLRRLSPKAMQVLALLAARPGVVISRDDFLDQVWPDVTVSEEVLTQAVTELRRKLGDDPRAPRYIETVPKAGYRLIAAVAKDPSGIQQFPISGSFLHKPFDFDAYLMCLEADEMFERGGHENVLTAADRFSAAIRSDPEFALAHAGFSKAMSFLHLYYAPQKGHLDLALEASERATQLEPTSALGYSARGMALSAMGLDDAALHCFGSAIHLDPSGFDHHYLFGRACFAGGQFKLAAAAFKRAARLRGEDFHALTLSAKAHRALGDKANAQRLYQLALWRIEAYRELEPDDVRAICDLACCLAEIGDCDGALRLAERVDDLDDPLTYYAACAFASAGEVPLALSHLEKTVEAGWSHNSWLGHDPDLNILRKEPRFHRIEHAVANIS
jgi:DNA-binding winged helix-turn-helix (wHTH) protein/tetratricopeptide (TPR) repeat protein